MKRIKVPVFWLVGALLAAIAPCAHAQQMSTEIGAFTHSRDGLDFSAVAVVDRTSETPPVTATRCDMTEYLWIEPHTHQMVYTPGFWNIQNFYQDRECAGDYYGPVSKWIYEKPHTVILKPAVKKLEQDNLTALNHDQSACIDSQSEAIKALLKDPKLLKFVKTELATKQIVISLEDNSTNAVSADKLLHGPDFTTPGLLMLRIARDSKGVCLATYADELADRIALSKTQEALRYSSPSDEQRGLAADDTQDAKTCSSSVERPLTSDVRRDKSQTQIR